jgi:ppGpp synthetase/RelA/SpoT-type nucleotidyltranferase
MALHDPQLHEFISYLAQKKAEQEADPDAEISIELSRRSIIAVREAFRRKILDGERHLHLLAHLLASTLLEVEFELHSNVIGVLPGDQERPFLIRERIAQETLFSFMDIDLGNQMLDNFRYHQDRSWVPLQLSANFVEYIPVRQTSTGVNRLTSRVKAEEELWNKVTDEIFHLDDLVTRDKHFRQYSKYIKDIFGIKIVCDDEATCVAVHDRLTELDLPGAQNGSLTGGTLELIETKDYLTCSWEEMKKTGWKAFKSVGQWHDRLFEIQAQPLNNYYLELDHMSGPSHGSFKLRRDTMREEIARQLPLYRFYRNLLRMLFKDADVLSFDCDKVSVIISD